MASDARKLRAVETAATRVRARTATTRMRPRTLLSAVTAGSTEREMLVILRHMAAVKLDQDDVPAHVFDRIARTFQQLDTKIRAIDARADDVQDADDSGDEDRDGVWDASTV
jgi:hypothetical protein